jgi:hypothetical protein
MKSDKIYLSLSLLMILTIVSWISSCSHQANIADMPEICFEGDVKPIFNSFCAKQGCHDGTGESDLVLNTYLEISQAVVPGNPNSSKLYNAITVTWGENKMPPDQPLSLENRTLIRLWIEQGARPTVCPVITLNGESGGSVSKLPTTGSFYASKSDN